MNQDLIAFEVAKDMTIGEIKQIIFGEINIPPQEQALYFHNRTLDDARTLEQVGIESDAMLGLKALKPPTQAALSTQPESSQRQQQAGPQGMPDPETLRLHILGNPMVREGVRRQNPELADAADDVQRFRDVLTRQQRQQAAAEAEKQTKIAMLNADPFNLEAQKEIEEIIRQNAVTENLQTAMEHTPEGEW